MIRLLGVLLATSALLVGVFMAGSILFPLNPRYIPGAIFRLALYLIFWALPNALYYSLRTIRQGKYPWPTRPYDAIPIYLQENLSGREKFIASLYWPPMLVTIFAVGLGLLEMMIVWSSRISLMEAPGVFFWGVLGGTASSLLIFLVPMLPFLGIHVGLLPVLPPKTPAPHQPVRTARQALWVVSVGALLILTLSTNDTVGCITTLTLLGYAPLSVLMMRSQLRSPATLRSWLPVILAGGTILFGFAKSIYLYIYR